MITISKSAAGQIEFSARENDIDKATMRIAIKVLENGCFHYALGFDESISEHDVKIKSEGVDLVISPESLNHARELTIDYVELDSGEKNFIFINPADPNYSVLPDRNTR